MSGMRSWQFVAQDIEQVTDRIGSTLAYQNEDVRGTQEAKSLVWKHQVSLQKGRHPWEGSLALVGHVAAK